MSGKDGVLYIPSIQSIWNIWDSSHNWWFCIFLPVRRLLSGAVLFTVMSLWREEKKPATLPPSGDLLSASQNTCCLLQSTVNTVKTDICVTGRCFQQLSTCVPFCSHSASVHFLFSSQWQVVPVRVETGCEPLWLQGYINADVAGAFCCGW